MPYLETPAPQTRRDFVDEIVAQSRSVTAYALELTKQPANKPYDLEVILALGEMLKSSLDGLKSSNNK